MIKRKRLVIFDLDDTLITSDAKIHVYDASNNNLLASMTAGEFNYHVRNQSQYFNFDDFECEKILGKSKIVKNSFRSFKRYYSQSIPLSIITARNDEKIIYDFFKSKNIKLKPSLIFAIHNIKYPFTGNVASRKQQAIQTLIKKGYNDIIYYDDNVDNLSAAKELETLDVHIKTIHVKHG